MLYLLQPLGADHCLVIGSAVLCLALVERLARGFAAPLFNQQIPAVPLLLLIVRPLREGQSKLKSNDPGYCDNGRIGPSFCRYYTAASGRESYSSY